MADPLTLLGLVDAFALLVRQIKDLVDYSHHSLSPRHSTPPEFDVALTSLGAKYGQLEQFLRDLSDIQIEKRPEVYEVLTNISGQTGNLIFRLQDLRSVARKPKWYRVTASNPRRAILEKAEMLKLLLENALLRLQIPPRADIAELDSGPDYTSDDEIEGTTNRWRQIYGQVRVDSPLQGLDATIAHSERRASHHSSSRRGDRKGAWQSLRLLSLEDSSPVRGMASLYALEIFMGYVAEEEQNMEPAADSSSSSSLYWTQASGHAAKKSHRFRPCHYFDYICGTGTGGMSASLLGVMRFSVPEAINRMSRVLQAVNLSGSSIAAPIAASRTILPRGRMEIPQLAKALREQLENSIRTRGDDDGSDDRESAGEPNVLQQALLRADDDMCQTICITAMKVNKGAAMAHVLKSFGEQRSDSTASLSSLAGANDSRNMPIVDACLASVAPALYSTSVKIKGVTYKDAAALDVNSVWRTYQEADRHRDVKGIEFSLAIHCHRSSPRHRGGGSGAVNMRSDTSQSKSSSSSTEKSSFDPPPHKLEAATFQARYDRVLEEKFGRHAFHQLDLDLPSGAARGGFSEVRAFAKQYCAAHEHALRDWAAALVKARRTRARTREWSRFAGLKVPPRTNSPPLPSPPPPLPLPHLPMGVLEHGSGSTAGSADSAATAAPDEMQMLAQKVAQADFALPPPASATNRSTIAAAAPVFTSAPAPTPGPLAPQRNSPDH